MSEMLSARLTAVTDVATRQEVQRVATHVLARARFAAEGRIGLEVTPGGIGTPTFGDGVRLRIEGMSIVREDRAGSDRCPLTTLTACAVLAGVNLAEPFSVGHDTPLLGDDALTIDRPSLDRLMAFFAFAWDALTEARERSGGDASEIQLWPEHFDVAFVTTIAGDVQVNVGASPGDSYRAEPYFYVGPWGPERPGDAAYWNAPFGAVLHTDARDEALAFIDRGLTRLRA